MYNFRDMINTLLITNNEDVSNKIKTILNDKQEMHSLEISSISNLVEKNEINCDIIIYHIGKNEVRPFQVLKVLSENAPVIVLVNGDKLKDKNKTSIKLIQNGAKTILYDIKENVLVHSIERIYDLEYYQENNQEIKA
ncbi:MAG: hypothetical protein IJH34_05060 [Romboutsia sp.]|nr:hypothetical protein [Romboutsia sp.]